MKIQIVHGWVVVAVGLALLCGLPVIASALPVRVPGLTASQLRGRILASADESYAGYAESNATFGLPGRGHGRTGSQRGAGHQRGFGIQAVYVVVFLAAAWANFSTKDITA